MTTQLIVAKGVQLTDEERERYYAARKKWLERLKPIADAIDVSQRLTAADLNLIVDYGSSGSPYRYP